MAGKAFENLNKIFLSDTFRAWFDKTNQIVNTVNPLEIYGVTAGQGEVAGITLDYGSDGIVTIGLQIPSSITGGFNFINGVTFLDFVSVQGLTLELNPSGGEGATVYGRVVRSVNGQTGDVNLGIVTIPGNSADGDILFYESTPVAGGGTFHTYNLFSDGTAENGNFHIGADGGLFAGVTAGGASAANSFVTRGNIQLVGKTGSAGIYMVDNLSTNNAQIGGADIRYETETGSNVFSIGGRNIAGVKHNTKNLILDFNKQSIAVAGAGTGDGNVNIGDAQNLGKPILYTDAGGSTFALRYLLANENGGRTSGGFTGITHFSGGVASKGLKNDERIRLENVAGSVEIELTGTGKTSGFAVYGVEPTSGYGNLLVPSLVARRDGNVVIGGIAPSDGGITGSTHGGLNIASGKLYVGGSAGAIKTSGYQFLHSNGISAEWRSLEQTSFSFNGDIGSLASGLISEDTTAGVFVSMTTAESTPVAIKFKDTDNSEMIGPFSATFNFPGVKPNGSMNSTNKGVMGIRMTLDGVTEDKFITWDDLMYNSVGPAGSNPALTNVFNPSFTFTGNAKTGVSFIPFMTKGPASTTNQTFTFVHRGTYLVEFHKLG
tara:strand:+ start:39 stop:1850 length:1812 start_codon:yes stop_codon:yes gene_type:complete